METSSSLMLIAASALVIVCMFSITIISIFNRNRRRRWENIGKDIVVLHMFQRGRHLPNPSPFVLKLETYLRMSKIQYEVDFDEATGPKGKSPWITMNGEHMGDSQLIIEKLAKHFRKDFSTHLTPEQKSIAFSMRVTVEEYLLWFLAVWRFGDDNGKSFMKDFNPPAILRFVMPLFKRQVKKSANIQGVGRHTQEEHREMGRKALAAVSNFLGNKPYFMGDEPTEVDCTMFGFLAQLVWGTLDNCPYHIMIENEFTNIKPYCFRMKDKYWPDWNACLKPPKIE